jgi:hypothetical protein
MTNKNNEDAHIPKLCVDLLFIYSFYDKLRNELDILLFELKIARVNFCSFSSFFLIFRISLYDNKPKDI